MSPLKEKTAHAIREVILSKGLRWPEIADAAVSTVLEEAAKLADASAESWMKTREECTGQLGRNCAGLAAFEARTFAQELRRMKEGS
jgi:pyrroline-5-carboxylate reductase